MSKLILYHECYSDGQFLKTFCDKIGIQYQNKHKQGRSKLLKEIATIEEHFIAIVDEDVNDIDNFYRKISSFEEIHNFSSLKIKIYGNKLRGQYIIIVTPRIEAWIIHIINLLKINLEHYHLKKNESSLHALSNKKDVEKLRPVFLECFKNKEMSKFVSTLEGIIKSIIA